MHLFLQTQRVQSNLSPGAHRPVEAIRTRPEEARGLARGAWCRLSLVRQLLCHQRFIPANLGYQVLGSRRSQRRQLPLPRPLNPQGRHDFLQPRPFTYCAPSTPVLLRHRPAPTARLSTKPPRLRSPLRLRPQLRLRHHEPPRRRQRLHAHGESEPLRCFPLRT